ncbi:MAG: DUF4013 domain-containing protein [Methanobacteriaceae archaeon]|jgi:hypothetical protein|nr:DUF4013 domain-containing protein [Methanobacteriaceae archaeon]
MDFSEIFKDSLNYPFNNYRKFLAFGLLLIIIDLIWYFVADVFDISFELGALLFLSGLLITFLLGFVIDGYLLSVLRSTIDYDEDIPKISFFKNLVDGLKVLIVNIVYYVFALFFVIIAAFLSGFIGSLMKIFEIIGANPDMNPDSLGSLVPYDLVYGLGLGFWITLLVFLIIMIIFSFVIVIARARLAETNEIEEAINIHHVLSDIKEIGIINYIIWAILLILISFVIIAILAFALASISFIPQFGQIIALIIQSLLIVPFLNLFLNRAIGLLYISKDN